MQVRPAQRVIRSWSTDSRRWNGYAPRPGDIVIATSAKCGTTWMQQIVSLLVFQSPEPRPLRDVSPWIDHRMAPLEQVMAAIEAQTHRRFLKAHLPADALPLHDDVRYIHVARDGRDAFMSWHNHSIGFNEMPLKVSDLFGEQDETIGRPMPRASQDPHEFFQVWMTEGEDARLADDFPASRYFDTERSWWAVRNRANVLMVHFNDLKADLDGEMRRIATFLGIDVNNDVWPALVEAADFRSMQKNGAQLLPNAGRAWDKGHERFLHKGTNARWRAALTADDIARYAERVSREVPPDLARWLKRGREGADNP